MGYFVQGHGTIVLRPNSESAVHKVLCDLNERDDLKRGGRWGGDEIDSTSPRPEGMDHHPGKWFSWMDANYPSECDTFQAVLEMLGFTVSVSYSLENNIHVTLSYDNKTGQEDLFLQALAPFTIRGEVSWRGEDGLMWQDTFTNGRHKLLQGKIVFS